MRTTRPRGSGRQRSHQQQVVTPHPEFDTGPLSSTTDISYSPRWAVMMVRLGDYFSNIIRTGGDCDGSCVTDDQGFVLLVVGS